MIDTFFSEPYRFKFFQAVRLLERIYPDREPVGRAMRPGREVVRFCGRVSLTFPPSEIESLSRGDGENDQARMTVCFLGLTGLLGVLPQHYTQFLIERAREKDFVARDFFDIFNHRLISLFYRAWEKYHFPIAYERTRNDSFSQYLNALVGVGTGGLQHRLAFPDNVLRFYAGFFSQRPHSAVAFECMLGDYFGVPAAVVQFAGQCVPVGPENVTRLGRHNSALGVAAICGDRIWHRQSKFRIRIGPLSMKHFRKFLPLGEAFKELVQMARMFAGTEFDFDVHLILRASEVPACRLQSEGEQAHLGWSSWLKTREFIQDSEDAILHCNN